MKPTFLSLILFTALLPGLGQAQQLAGEALKKSLLMQKAILQHGDLDAVKEILKGGFDLNSPVGCGPFSVVDGAVAAENPEILKFFLDAGAEAKGSALLAAASCKNFGTSQEMAEMLLAKGADPNFKSMLAPLHMASYLGNSAVVEMLLKHPKIDVNIPDADGRTPLMCAVQGGHEMVVKMLLEKGADPSAKAFRGPEPRTAAGVAQFQLYKSQRILAMLSAPRSGGQTNNPAQ
jgi:ankyrin repeat protein